MKHPALTDKQKDFFEALVRLTAEHERWPSHQELMDEFGFKSPRSVSQLYEALISCITGAPEKGGNLLYGN